MGATESSDGMRNALLVGVSGPMHSGKDTLAAHIADSTSLPHKTVRFAAAIKACIAGATGTTYEFQNSHEGKNTLCDVAGVTFGVLQQTLGRAGREECGPDIWVRAALGPYLGTRTEGAPHDGLVLIPDVRFPNEATTIRRAGGVLIRMTGDPSGEAALDSRDKNDATETALNEWTDWDLVIDNACACDADARTARFAPVCTLVASMLGPAPVVRLCGAL